MTIDYKNKEIKIDSKGSSTSSHTFTGENGIPSGVDRGKLNFVIYPQDTSGLANNEYYITKPVIEYERFVPAEDTSDGVTVGGTASNIKKITLTNTAQTLYKHSAVVGEDNTFSLEKVPAGTYSISYELAEGSSFKEISGTGVSKGEDGLYYITVTGAVSDLAVTAEKITSSDAAKDALTNYFDSVYTKDNGVYTVDTAISVPDVEGYTIAIKEATENVNADGTLKRGENGTTAEINKLTFTIKIDGSDGSEDVVYDVIVPSKTASVYEGDFEDVLAGSDSVVKYDDTRGNVVKVSLSDTNKVVANWGSLPDGIYAFSWDFMHDGATSGNNGWKMQLGSAIKILYKQAGLEQLEAGDKYTSNDVYGASGISFAGEDNKWYNMTMVMDTVTKHIDLYIDGEYKTSYKGGGAPTNLELFSYWNPTENIYADNIRVERLDTNFQEEFEAAMSADGISAIPTDEVEADSTLTLPTTTASGNKIEWSSSNDSVIEINGGNVTLKAQPAGGSAVLKATVTSPAWSAKYPGCTNEGVVDTISYSKEYVINFKQTSTSTFSVSGKVSFEYAPNVDTDVKITLTSSGGSEESKTVTVNKDSAESDTYTIDGLVEGASYTVSAEVVTQDSIYKVRYIQDENGSDITNVSSNGTVNVVVGQWINSYTIDFEDGDAKGEYVKKNALTAEVVSEPSDSGNKVLKLSTSGAASADEGYYWNLVDLLSDSEALADVDKVSVSYKLMNADGKYKSTMDIGYGLAETVDKKAKDNLFLRADLGNQWDQVNFCNASGGYFVAFGDAKLNANLTDGYTGWYDFNLDIDYKNSLLAGKVATNGKEGTFDLANGGSYNCPFNNATYEYPNGINGKDDITLAFYPTNANSSGVEWYMDDITISYEGWR